MSELSQSQDLVAWLRRPAAGRVEGLAADEIEQLRARVAALETSLVPFAGLAISDNWNDAIVFSVVLGYDNPFATPQYMTVGDVRRARAALAEGKKG
jgi:hypothetical protein